MSNYAQEFLDRTRPFQAVITGDDGHTYDVQTSQVAVTTTSGQLLSSNPRRVSWTLCNFGTGQAYVSWKASTLTTTGFPLLASGGTLETAQIDDKNVARMAMSVIGDANTTIAVIEVVRLD